MSDAIKEMVSVSADSFWYHERLAVGRMVYLTGWVVWFVSLWMPARVSVLSISPNLDSIFPISRRRRHSEYLKQRVAQQNAVKGTT